ncbi:MAG: dynamin family protein [Clostridia bacterium]|nr:dynamin family protein [Clostridia bacterium]
MSNNYTNYQEKVTTITTGIERLAGNGGVLRNLNLPEVADDLSAAGDKLKKHIFSVGIMGEFKRGKSTVINALLGQEIVPADILPCSATLNYIKYDTQKHAEIRFKDGTTKEVGVEELSNYVAKLTEESAATAETVEDAIVYYPCPLCQNGVQIVDTPGLNDDDRMTAITEKVIPTMDAIIMVVVPDSPFSQSEAEFVRNKLMTSDLGKLIFVVNKIDTIDEDDIDKVVAGIKTKIIKSVLDKMALVHGEDSAEYNNAKKKIGEVKIIPVSARKALKGKLKNNSSMIEESGFLEFENALSKMLTEERGIIELLPPMNKIVSAAKIALDNIETRSNGLKLDAEEFDKLHTESANKITEARAKKKEELASLKAKGKNLHADLLPEINESYNTIENMLLDYVDSYPIDPETLTTEEGVNTFSNEFGVNLDDKINENLLICTERLTYRIREQLGKDIKDIHTFSIELENDISDIHNNIRISANSGDSSGYSSDALIGLSTSVASGLLFDAVFPGVGGIISGYREHGLKGAVVGGIAGGMVGSVAIGLGIGLVGALTWPVAIIGGIASAFGGKAITNFFFGKKNKKASPDVETIRDNLRDAVRNVIGEMRKDSQLEEWLKETCEAAYDKIGKEIDEELEKALASMEETLTQIKIDIKLNQENKTKCEKELNDSKEIITSVLESLKSVEVSLNSASERI